MSGKVSGGNHSLTGGNMAICNLFVICYFTTNCCVPCNVNPTVIVVGIKESGYFKPY